MTPDLPTSAEIAPDPRLEKRTRRRFSAAEKLRLLTEADALPNCEQGAWLRRNGLYAAQLSGWRKQHAERGLDGLQAQAPGRKGTDPRDRRIDQLQRENRRLHRRAEVAEQLIELQKKVFQLVEKAQQEKPRKVLTRSGCWKTVDTFRPIWDVAHRPLLGKPVRGLSTYRLVDGG
jgi:transposase-like protein